ncbi:DUF305 domain-containing protein [Modestobacter sp. VKM Ac-2979]|uniref:DUF305 domain-containing protein n=1 Tax=unclassified Modestobacter TaxID=2643866 RepID=UPI0022AB9ACD|nr:MULTISPECIES: DUF305 domain-containing protein [unclassified Modestobacter]MCZ2811923.1 DUF305 domain-containing protein [Modestobacter sp. VKM Ac-2979]MCZ2843646.1 DUF305 domain-containing protein [Modestobacter sp. VKM Ac-2980]
MTRTSIRLVRLTGGLMAAVVVLAGCSDTEQTSATGGNAADDSSAEQGAEFNDTDVAFAQGMIPHHEGALMMSAVAIDRASDPRVVDLAERIEAGQDPEIDLMTAWLEEWGQPLEESGSMGGMDHGSGDMGGMGMDGGMGMEEMPAAGRDFGRMWLDAMIEHHEGAVEMARTEVEDGRNAEAVDLARSISEVQAQEIEEMRQLLTELGG